MHAFNNISSLIGGEAVVAISVALTAGLAPSSAAPQNSPGVIMGVHDDPGNSANYVVRVQGKFPMSEGDAYDRLNHLSAGGGIEYTIYADDPGENDSIITSPGFVGSPGPTGGALIATPYGISFMREISVPRSKLNEDDGADELYTRVRLVQGNGVPDLRGNTNAVSGDF